MTLNNKTPEISAEFLTQYEKGVLDERLRISRMLHDEIASPLSILQMMLSQVKRGIDISPEILTNLKALVQQISFDSRNLSHDLGSKNINLLSAKQLQNEVNNLVNYLKFSAPDIRCTSDLNLINSSFITQSSICLLRCTQELINNTIKYSEATDVKLSMGLNKQSNIVYLTYSDNGKFKLDHLNVSQGKGLKTKGIGLDSMRFRVNQLNGTMEIKENDPYGFYCNIQISY